MIEERLSPEVFEEQWYAAKMEENNEQVDFLSKTRDETALYASPFSYTRLIVDLSQEPNRCNTNCDGAVIPLDYACLEYVTHQENAVIYLEAPRPFEKGATGSVEQTGTVPYLPIEKIKENTERPFAKWEMLAEGGAE